MPSKPIIEWWSVVTGDAEVARVTAVLRGNYLNEGEVTSEFERRIAGLVGAKHAIATTSGTSALFLSLKACGIGHGDEVIVPDLTFIASANAVALTGATPVLVDIDPSTLNMDPESFRRAIGPT